MPVLPPVCRMPISSSCCTSGGELLGAADDAEADVVLEQRAELEPDVPLEQHHQRVDFGARPLPVLDRERVEREHVDAEPRRGFDDVAHRVDAGAVAFDARQVALRRPAPVAVHDDGDVRRQLLEVDLARQRFVGRSRRNPRQELLKRHDGSFGVNLDCTRSAQYVDARRETGPAAGAVGPACRAIARREHLGHPRRPAGGRVRPRPACRRSRAPCAAESRSPQIS